MASKVLVPTSPFSKLQVKKSPPESSGGGFVIGNSEPAARIAHLEHSVRFLQEQHRLMLNGLHAEIEALRDRNRDLQFQLIFNKESTLKTPSSSSEEIVDNTEEANLKRDINRLEKELSAAKSEARAAEARALQLQQLVDAQTEKLQALSVSSDGEETTRGELRARLAEAERLVRRLRSDERRRTEVLRGGAATNLLFDAAAARQAHLQCMKNSLHASLRGAALDGLGYQNTYHFPPVRAAPDFWREPTREEVEWGSGAGRGRPRRTFVLPELATSPTTSRATIFVNHHARPRPSGFENKIKKTHTVSPMDHQTNGKSPEELLDNARYDLAKYEINQTYPELKVVVTKLLPSNIAVADLIVSPAPENNARRPRRHHHRKLTDHT